jgi:hypothetical protein
MFTKLNTTLTAIAALSSTAIGVWVAFINAHISELEQRQKAEQTSYNFAHEFLTLGKGDWGKDPRQTQLAVAALNIIAQASSSKGGESDVAARAELPIHVALLYGDAGSIAVLDRELTQSDRWVEFASADPDNSTRLTAIKALDSLCRRALSDGNLSRVEACVKSIDRLLNLINEDESTEALQLHTAGLSVKTKLGLYLQNKSADLDAATTLAQGETRDAASIRLAIRKEMFHFGDTVTALQDSLYKLRSSENQPTAQNGGAAATTTLTDATAQQRKASVQQTIAASNEALSAVARSVSAAPSQAATQAAVTVVDIPTLIADLANPEDTAAAEAKRKKARSELALRGQDVIKPLLGELMKRQGKNGKDDANMRRGGAIALSRMQQPIALEEEQSNLIVGLLGASDKETRLAAVDFLMNLEDRATVLYAYDSLVVLAKDRRRPENGTAVKNAATVLGTWVRALPPDLLALDETTPMRDWCRKTVEGLKAELQKENVKLWAGTISTISELLERANQTREKAVAAG